jgi:hypothetical protein
MISNIDPVELEHVLRPTIYLPDGQGMDRVRMGARADGDTRPLSDPDAQQPEADRLSAVRLRL